MPHNKINIDLDLITSKEQAGWMVSWTLLQIESKLYTLRPNKGKRQEKENDEFNPPPFFILYLISCFLCFLFAFFFFLSFF